ncbi:unnamed protein product [Durusdinium trenchii]|uniref:Thymus-specific serine protease n=2 Tax=Durusdinium trenchii TaxID=1381693 RepID=A0ABP0J1Z7_9DINO
MTCEEDSNCPWTRGYNDMSFWFDMCETAFGFNESDVRHHVATTNAFYGGTRFPGGSHVVFANGEVDPWHWLSILVPPGGAEANIDTIWVPGASHCQWMQNTWDSMPRALHAAKEAIQNRIALWIS